MKPYYAGLLLLSGSLMLLLSESVMSQTVTVHKRDQIVKAVERAIPGTTILMLRSE